MQGEKTTIKVRTVLSVSWGSDCLPGRPSSWVTLTDPGCVLGGPEVCRRGVGRGHLALGPCASREAGAPPSRSTACRLRELCVKLMFLHPVDYGRKAEELLWRKVYYEVIQLIKTNKKVRGGPGSWQAACLQRGRCRGEETAGGVGRGVAGGSGAEGEMVGREGVRGPWREG